jgi:hypothetical protein
MVFARAVQSPGFWVETGDFGLERRRFFIGLWPEGLRDSSIRTLRFLLTGENAAKREPPFFRSGKGGSPAGRERAQLTREEENQAPVAMQKSAYWEGSARLFH